MRSLLVILPALFLHAQTALPPDLDAFTKIRTRMLFNLRHQPNYTCVETIERSTRSKSTARFKIVDTLRLEVALVDGREMFAWPGSRKFDDFDVTKMITSGAIGNGNFATHARALFETRSATFHYQGVVDFEKKKAIRFDYDVPQMLSGFRIRASEASAIVAYHGSFYASPETFDMERMNVIADDIPAELMLASTEDRIDYAIARIGEGDFLLPSESDLSMVNSNGSENHNHVKFTSCRQFSGESVITFGDAPESKPDAAPLPTRAFDLPDGLEIQLVLTEQIDLQKAAIGDPVSARVDHDVKKNGQMVIPKGATAAGRITRLEKHETYSMIGIEFPEIEAPGVLARMKGRLERTMGILPATSSRRESIRSQTPAREGEGVFPVGDMQLHVPKGCIMFWRT
ncbi:MAG TPA: hypothetical protein VNU44_18905 [Bryobacteraceae bacterium]|nr:hypothetical protein [Bryobacteraceae bacterium]